MTTSTFFNPYAYKNEQEMLDSLVQESIKIYGIDMYYIPRRRDSYDEMYAEDDTGHYDKAYVLEMYVKSVDGFGGQGAFFSKFGLEIRDQVILSISSRRFTEEITTVEPSIVRPREKDLIYFPLNKKCFQIMYTENKPFFYQLGSLPMFDVTCELFEYAQEIFNTGVEEIDNLQRDYSINAYDYGIKDENGNFITGEDGVIITSEEETIIQDVNQPENNNIDIENDSDRDSANSLINWDETSPFTGSNTGRY